MSRWHKDEHGYLDEEELRRERNRGEVAPGKRTLASQIQTAPEVLARLGGSCIDRGNPALTRASQRSGTSLPADMRARLERASGADLSSVQVHTGPESQRAAASISARAFAFGQDIHFGAGQYVPDSPGGQRLIAHEVAHTVQQRGASPATQAKLDVSSRDDAHEREADAFADAVMAGLGRRVPLTAAPASISRTPTHTDATPPLDNSGEPASKGGGILGGGIHTARDTDNDKVSDAARSTAPASKSAAHDAVALGLSTEEYSALRACVLRVAGATAASMSADAKQAGDIAKKREAQTKNNDDVLEIDVPIDASLLQSREAALQLMIRAVEAALVKYGAKKSRGDIRRMLILGSWHHLDGDAKLDHAGVHNLIAAELKAGRTTIKGYRLRGLARLMRDWGKHVEAKAQQYREFSKQIARSNYALDAIKSFYIAHYNGAASVINGAVSLVTLGRKQTLIPKVSYPGDYGKKYGATLELGATMGIGVGGAGLLLKGAGQLGAWVGTVSVGGVNVGPGMVTAAKAYLVGAGLRETHEVAQQAADDILVLATGEIEEGRQKTKDGRLMRVSRTATPEEKAARMKRLMLIVAGTVIAAAAGKVKAQGGKAGWGTRHPDSQIPEGTLITRGRDKGKRRIEEEAGSKGNFNRNLNRPKPDRKYDVDGYIYVTDPKARVERVEVADLKLQKQDRNSYQQRKSGGKDRGENDQGGHLIASIFKGPGEGLNLVPMNANLNQGKWKKLENLWAKALSEKPPQKVSVKIKVKYSGDSRRPIRFDVEYKIGSGDWKPVKLKNPF